MLCAYHTPDPFTSSILCIFVSNAIFVSSGTLTPDGTIPLDCVSAQTFTCSVTGGAAWTISLDGISVTAVNGLSAANNNPRITTNDTSGVTPSSTITITGFILQQTMEELFSVLTRLRIVIREWLVYQ